MLSVICYYKQGFYESLHKNLPVDIYFFFSLIKYLETEWQDHMVNNWFFFFKWKWNCSVMSDSLWSHGLQPTRLLHPWNFPGKSTGVGCHCLLRSPSAAHVKPSIRERYCAHHRGSEVAIPTENKTLDAVGGHLSDVLFWEVPPPWKLPFTFSLFVSYCWKILKPDWSLRGYQFYPWKSSL